MSYKILILGASYGSLLGTKCAMAGHDVTLVCRAPTAKLINEQGTDVRIKLRGEEAHRSILSGGLPGKIDACVPEDVNPAEYDLVGLAMQEPQYANQTIGALMKKIGEAGTPCLSIMNMPPLAYLRRIPNLDTSIITSAYTDASIWDAFDPEAVTLCSPDPQAFRPPEEAANVLHVGLPTNFKSARFSSAAHNEVLTTLEADIAAVMLDGNDVPVKLRVYETLFVPMAKWSMLLTGNYRCVTAGDPQPICDAVHSDIEKSAEIYAFVDSIARALGAEADELVPFEKYATAAKGLLKPSSAARAVAGGASVIERVDKLVQLTGRALGLEHPSIDETVAIVDKRLAENAS